MRKPTDKRVWMRGSTCRLSVKISLLCRLSVNKSQLIFLSLVGNFFLVLSVVSSIFSPFLASRFTPFTSSNNASSNHFETNAVNEVLFVFLSIGTSRKTRRQRQRERHQKDVYGRYYSWYNSLPSFAKQQPWNDHANSVLSGEREPQRLADEWYLYLELKAFVAFLAF